MRRISFLIVFILLSVLANAQKGQKQFNAGLGFANNTIPVYFGFDYWVHEDVSIGVEVGWRRDKWRANNIYYYQDMWSFSFNSNYHFSRLLKIPNKFDPYAGLNVGFYRWEEDNDPNWDSSHTSGLGLGAQIGFRFFFNDHVGIGLEFMGGNKISDGKIGVSIRF